jgi:hypothetical protein
MTHHEMCVEWTVLHAASTRATLDSQTVGAANSECGCANWLSATWKASCLPLDTSLQLACVAHSLRSAFSSLQSALC